MTDTQDSLLRHALRANAIFSIVSGSALLLAAGPIAKAMGIPAPWLVAVTGVSLLIFAVGLLRNAARDRIDTTEAAVTVGLDAVWVLGSGVVLAMGVLTAAGNLAVAVVADVVLLLAVVQFIGLRRL